MKRGGKGRGREEGEEGGKKSKNTPQSIPAYALVTRGHETTVGCRVSVSTTPYIVVVFVTTTANTAAYWHLSYDTTALV